MHYLIVIVLLLSPGFAVSQTTEKEIILPCIANWEKGEKKILHITRKKDSFEAEKNKSTFELSFEAHISVLDSSEDGYKMQWVFHLPEAYKAANPGIGDVMPVYEGLKMIFTTSDFGEFKELLNWEEVRDAYVKMMLQSIPGQMNDSASAILDRVINMFNSKDIVENTLIKEIQIYHLPYGAEFSNRGTTGTALLPNPLGGDPLPSLIVQKITEYDKPNEILYARSDHQVDMKMAKDFAESFVRTMGISEDSVFTEVKRILARLEIADVNEFRISLQTGWINRMLHKRVASVGDMKQVETVQFEMEIEKY